MRIREVRSRMPLWMFRQMAELLTDVALSDPLAAALLVVGNLILAFSIGAFGVLTLGAVGSLIRRE